MTGGDTHHYTNEDDAALRPGRRRRLSHVQPGPLTPHPGKPAGSCRSSTPPLTAAPPPRRPHVAQAPSTRRAQLQPVRRPRPLPAHAAVGPTVEPPWHALPGSQRAAIQPGAPGGQDRLRSWEPGPRDRGQKGGPSGRTDAAGLLREQARSRGLAQRAPARSAASSPGPGPDPQPDPSPSPGQAPDAHPLTRRPAAPRPWDPSQVSVHAPSPAVRMAERSKALRSGRSLPWRRGFESHS